MHMESHQRSQHVFFHKIGLTGNNGNSGTKWNLKTLKTIQQDLSHKKVKLLFSLHQWLLHGKKLFISFLFPDKNRLSKIWHRGEWMEQPEQHVTGEQSTVCHTDCLWGSHLSWQEIRGYHGNCGLLQTTISHIRKFTS